MTLVDIPEITFYCETCKKPRAAQFIVFRPKGYIDIKCKKCGKTQQWHPKLGNWSVE